MINSKINTDISINQTIARIKKDKKYSYIGRFKNEYGEVYILWEYKNKDKFGSQIYFSGDETDWEVYQLDEVKNIGYKLFIFSDDELNKIKKVIKKYNDK